MRNLSIFLVAFFSVYFGSYYLLAQKPEAELPNYGKVTDFVLSDQKGKPLRFSETGDSPRLISFFFTSCPHICPMLQGNVKKLHDKYGPRVTLLSVTVDPEHDTTEVLAKFAEKMSANYSSWRFLHAEKEKLYDVLHAVKLGSGKGKEDHTTRIVLVDGNDQIRGYYKGLEPKEIERLKNDIERL